MNHRNKYNNQPWEEDDEGETNNESDGTDGDGEERKTSIDHNNNSE